MLVLTQNQAKAKADTLHKFLTERGLTVPKSDMLNAVARMAGFEDWNAMAAEFRPEAVDAQLRDHERKHAYDSLESSIEGFGPECVVQVASGFWLAAPAYRGEDDEGADYVRVCDQLGREIVYWSADEFTEDAAQVLGALVGALNHGRADLMPNPGNPVADKLVVADRTRKASPKKRRGLAELDWGKVSRICVGEFDAEGEDGPGVYFNFQAYHDHEEEMLRALDAEREGTADADDLAFLDECAEDIALDWGDEYEAEGIKTSELRGIQMAPNSTWKLQDGRILRFMQMTPME